MSELHLRFRIPNEYIETKDEDSTLLDFPISYAESFAEMLAGACNHFYADVIAAEQPVPPPDDDEPEPNPPIPWV